MASVALHKVARGLLEILRARTGGRYPDELGLQVQPVVNLEKFYTSDLLETGDGGNSVGALANLTEAFVPSQMVLLYAVGGILTIGAAAATNVTVDWGIQLPGGGNQQCGLGSQFIAQLPAASVVTFGTPLQGLVCPIGFQTYFRVTGTAAGADHTVAARVVVAPLTP